MLNELKNRRAASAAGFIKVLDLNGLIFIKLNTRRKSEQRSEGGVVFRRRDVDSVFVNPFWAPPLHQPLVLLFI